MTNDEAMRVDAEEAAGMMVVDFGEAGQKQWRDELRAAAGMRELARLLLAGVPQEEAYRLAVELESKQPQVSLPDAG